MSDGANFSDFIQNCDMPLKKAILQYLVRMGSFTSGPIYPNEDIADDDVFFPLPSTWNQLEMRCEREMRGFPRSLVRSFVDVGPAGKDKIRVMQWNVLAQALSQGVDKFIRCPSDAMSWQIRRWRLLAEMAKVQPDILCLQEVDHFHFFQKALTSIRYQGFFCPKPESPCLRICGNNGPDGCAIFINTLKFDVLDIKTRTLEVCEEPTNQVAIFCKLRQVSDGAELWVATTHLKAHRGDLLEQFRENQGWDLHHFIERTVGKTTPLLLCGDMNANPTESVHSVFALANLRSVYLNQEPSFTTWTIREDGEHCSTLDYIFCRQGHFNIKRLLQLPAEQDIGADRVPSYTYPSDHFALVADLVLHHP